MGLRLVLGVVTLCACNAKIDDGPIDATAGMDGRTDSTPDSLGSLDAALGAWGAAQPVTGASNSSISQDDCTLNSTETELYFKVPNAANVGSAPDLWWMTRAQATDAWGIPAMLP